MTESRDEIQSQRDRAQRNAGEMQQRARGQVQGQVQGQGQGSAQGQTGYGPQAANAQGTVETDGSIQRSDN
jgi:hypothetical protein